MNIVQVFLQSFNTTELSKRNTKPLIERKISIKKISVKTVFKEIPLLITHFFIFFFHNYKTGISSVNNFLYIMQPNGLSSVMDDTIFDVFQFEYLIPSFTETRILDRSFKISVKSFFEISCQVSF